MLCARGFFDRGRRARRVAGPLGIGLLLIAIVAFTLIVRAASGSRPWDLPPLDPCPGDAAQAGEEWGERPPEILSWRHRILELEDYQALARQWEAYVREHPKDPRALVEWGDALRYSDRYREGVAKYAEAFAVDSSNAAAIAAHVCHAIHSMDENEAHLAHVRLMRAAREDPSCAEIYYTLFLTALRIGDEPLAAECLRRTVLLGDMPRPLLDWGGNIVAGAPANAIIFTNGDNDTYPPLAWQVLNDARSDVAIVNLSLLNTHWYIRYLRDKGLPITLDDEAVAALRYTRGKKVADQMQLHIFENLRRLADPRPLFYCVTVVEHAKILPAKLVMEGLLVRIVPADTAEPGCCPEVEWARTRECFDSVYRLDSMTDPYVDWTRESAVGSLGINYGALLHRLGLHLATNATPAEAGGYLFRAAEILAFHGRDEQARVVLDNWTELDPESRLLARARAAIAEF